MSEKRVPDLRFKGFSGDWEQRKLGELASFSKGSGYTKNDLVESGTPIILYGRLYTKYETVITLVNTFVLEKEKSVISEGNEVIVPTSGESSEDIARASVVGISGLILGGDLNIIKPIDFIDSVFLALTISSGTQKKEMSKRAQGKSVVHLHNSDLKKVDLLFPKLAEQQKIGAFFKRLDQIIALHLRKLDLLKQLKQGFLKQMFVCDGEKEPVVRFANFGSEWEQRELGEVVKFFPGLTYSPDNIVNENGTLVLRSSNVKSGEIVDADNVYVNPNAVNSDNVQVGDIVVVVRNGSRDLIGKHAQIKDEMENTVIGAFMTGIRSSKSNFINALLDTQKFKIEINKNLGATINQITTGTFKKMAFSISKNIEEQKKIGAFFQQLDNIITLHQSKIDKLITLKKAYLTKLFI